MSDDNRISRMGSQRRIGNPAWVGPDGRGRSGNPGGKPAVAKILDSIGMTTDDARRECVETALAWMRDPDASDKSRTYAHKFISDMVGLIFKQQLEVTGALTPEAQALLEALRLTPHERRAAQDSTAAEDDAAMSELTSDGDHGDEIGDR